MKHCENLIKLMTMKPQNVYVELYDADDNGFTLFIGNQCIGLFNDGRASYKRDYHNIKEETILCRDFNDLLDKICFA